MFQNEVWDEFGDTLDPIKISVIELIWDGVRNFDLA